MRNQELFGFKKPKLPKNELLQIHMFKAEARKFSKVNAKKCKTVRIITKNSEVYKILEYLWKQGLKK